MALLSQYSSPSGLPITPRSKEGFSQPLGGVVKWIFRARSLATPEGGLQVRTMDGMLLWEGALFLPHMFLIAPLGLGRWLHDHRAFEFCFVFETESCFIQSLRCELWRGWPESWLSGGVLEARLPACPLASAGEEVLKVLLNWKPGGVQFAKLWRSAPLTKEQLLNFRKLCWHIWQVLMFGDYREEQE